MRVEMSDSAIPHNTMKGKHHLSELDALKQREISRRRKMRIEQVRQQSKDIASLVRRRVQNKKECVLKTAENKENSELQSWNETKLKSLQRKYEECLGEIGLAHTSASSQPDPVLVLASRKEISDRKAKIRAKEAREKLKAEREMFTERELLPKMQKKIVRSGEDLRSATVVSFGEKTANERDVRRPLGSTSVNVQRSVSANTVCHPVVVSSSCQSPEVQCVVSEENQYETSEDSTVPETFHGRSEGCQFVELPEVNVNHNRDSVREADSDLRPFVCDPSSIWERVSEKLSGLHNVSEDGQVPERKYLETRERCSVRDAACSPILNHKGGESRHPGGMLRCSQQRVIPVWTSRRGLRQAQLDSSGTCSHVLFYDHSARHQQKYNHPSLAVQKTDDLLQKNAMQAAEEESVAMQEAQKESFKIREQQEQLQQCRSEQALARERLRRQYQLLLSELQALSRRERLARSQSYTTSAATALLAETRRKEAKYRRQKNMDSVFERIFHTCNETITDNAKNVLPEIPAKRTHDNFTEMRSPIEESKVKLNVGHYSDLQKALKMVPPREFYTSEQLCDAATPSLNSQELKKSHRPDVRGREILDHQASNPQKSAESIEVEGRHLKYMSDKQKPTSVLLATSLSNESTTSELLANDNRNVLNSRNVLQGMEGNSTECGVHHENKDEFGSKEYFLTKADAVPTQDKFDLRQHFRVCNSDDIQKLSVPSEAHHMTQGVAICHELTVEQKQYEAKNGKHSECSVSNTGLPETIRPQNVEDRIVNDSLDRSDSTFSSSLYSTDSEYSISNAKGKYFVDEEASLKTSTSDVSGTGIKIVVKFCEQRGEREHTLLKMKQGQDIINRLDPEESKSYKHCKEHCGKKTLYTVLKHKQKSKMSDQTRNTQMDIDNHSNVSNFSENLQEMAKESNRISENSTEDGKYSKGNGKLLNKLYCEKDDISFVGRNPGKVQKEVDDNVNTTSASTSYFSPPEKLSAARAREIESAIETISSHDQMTDLKESRLSSALSCYIRRLLAMSRESIENLNVLSSEASTPSKKVLDCSENQQSCNTSINIENNERNASMTLPGTSHKQESAFLNTSDRGGYTKKIVKSDANSLSVFCESGTTVVGSKLPDYSAEFVGEDDFEELQKDQMVSKYNHAVTPEEHNNFIVAMNKRIVSALDNIADAVKSVEPNVTELDQKQRAAVSSIAQADLSLLAEKYSKRISYLSKQIESLRQEKHQIVEINSSDADAPAYASSPIEVATIAAEVVHSEPVTSDGSDSHIQAHKPKPPVSLCHKLIRDVWDPHELSTIVEVDSQQMSHTQAGDVTKHFEVCSANEALQSPKNCTVGLLDSDKKEEADTEAEYGNRFAENSPDVICDIMAELIKRKLLTSPYSWMKEDYNKQFATVAENSPANSQERESLFVTVENNSTSCHKTVDSMENVSLRNSSKYNTSCFESNVEDICTINSKARDLPSLFQKLGINWASSMLRKTRQARAFPASSSDSSHEESIREKKGMNLEINESTASRNSENSVMRQESSSCEYLNITIPDISLVTKYVIPNTKSDVSL